LHAQEIGEILRGQTRRIQTQARDHARATEGLRLRRSEFQMAKDIDGDLANGGRYLLGRYNAQNPDHPVMEKFVRDWFFKRYWFCIYVCEFYVNLNIACFIHNTAKSPRASDLDFSVAKSTFSSAWFFNIRIFTNAWFSTYTLILIVADSRSWILKTSLKHPRLVF